ncbi:MAG: pantoate--beta-alanine ligase [Deltaproteobacteria bacterium]|jgi:pantoate--beta-alanine ligase|nr:pantoate--beta-alanine ligase [Deltaproteobacteria bacterium]
MEILKTVPDLRNYIRYWKRQDKTIGLVPTMGYLHEGHASLIRLAVRDCDQAVVSIFVNPAQFAPSEDLASYPRDFERDRLLCQSLGVSVIFNPEPAEMYPPGFAAQVAVPALSQNLCGRSRPNHFQGVCTVVAKLFLLTEPERAYFGLKDAQQFFVLRRMVQDLNLELIMVPGPTVREADGLALSSRNAYLSPEERKAALVVPRALEAARQAVEAGQRETAPILKIMTGIIESEKLARLDYAEAVETAGLTPAGRYSGEILTALAVFVGRTRLIDNFLWNEGLQS